MLSSQFRLQLFVGRFGSHPGLLQLLFSSYTPGKLSPQLINDTLQFQRLLCRCLLQDAFKNLPFGTFILQLFVGRFGSHPGLLKLLFSSYTLGKFGLQLLNDTLQFQRLLCRRLLQAAFKLLPFGTFILQLLSGGFGIQSGLLKLLFGFFALGSQFRLQLFVGGFGSHSGQLQLFLSALALGKFRPQLINNSPQFQSLLCSCLLQAAFKLQSLVKFILQLFIGRLCGGPGLFQFLFGFFALGS